MPARGTERCHPALPPGRLYRLSHASPDVVAAGAAVPTRATRPARRIHWAAAPATLTYSAVHDAPGVAVRDAAPCLAGVARGLSVVPAGREGSTHACSCDAFLPRAVRIVSNPDLEIPMHFAAAVRAGVQLVEHLLDRKRW